MPKQIRQTPSLALPLYAASTIRETILEDTKPKMMAQLVEMAVSKPRFFCKLEPPSAASKA